MFHIRKSSISSGQARNFLHSSGVMYRSLQAGFCWFAGQDIFPFFSYFAFPQKASRSAVFVGPQMVGKLVMVFNMGM